MLLCSQSVEGWRRHLKDTHPRHTHSHCAWWHAGEGTPQCFLLTPKLLPDLPFTHSVNVLQIMNGPHIHVSRSAACSGPINTFANDASMHTGCQATQFSCLSFLVLQNLAQNFKMVRQAFVPSCMMSMLFARPRSLPDIL
jgi:hypothetical protein